jgi:predicted nucleic acid-binding protein
MAEIIAGVRSFAAQLRIAEDGPEVTEHLLGILEQISVGGRQLHDANIVATMQVNDIRRLLTHNPQDFARFTGLITVTPLVP